MPTNPWMLNYWIYLQFVGWLTLRIIKNVDICVFQKLHWLVITIQADIIAFQANTAYFITAWRYLYDWTKKVIKNFFHNVFLTFWTYLYDITLIYFCCLGVPLRGPGYVKTAFPINHVTFQHVSHVNKPKTKFFFVKRQSVQSHE